MPPPRRLARFAFSQVFHVFVVRLPSLARLAFFPVFPRLPPSSASHQRSPPLSEPREDRIAMISRVRSLPVFSALCLALSFGALGRAAPSKAAATVREPAVAGLFYPREPQALAAMIDRLLSQATTRPAGRLRALICP